MKPKLNIVFVHGWGLNSAIWQPYVQELSERLDITICNIDLPGYGVNAQMESPRTLEELTQHCLAQAPSQALWVGWSLGGMVALQAALFDSVASRAGGRAAARVTVTDRTADNTHSQKRVIGLQLINTTPCFVRKGDWACGVEISTFQKFNAKLSIDYRAALNSFLLLQAGLNKGARALVEQASQLLMKYPDPNAHTLQQGMHCLAQMDIRTRLTDIDIPTQIVSGRLDRVTNPECSVYMADQIEDAQHVTLNTGHAPLLTETSALADAFQLFVSEKLSSNRVFS